MSNPRGHSTDDGPPNAVAVGAEIRSEEHSLPLAASMEELELLAKTAGLAVAAEVTQKLDRPNPKTWIGSGKVNEVKALVDETESKIILFDNELSPRHQRELEKIFGEDIQVLDRTGLILDIFAQHASTREGALQVELAQYEYRLPRLTRAWTHLARQAGGTGSAGGVGLRGPGETQLEVDRREISRRISHLKRELEKVRAHRERHRARRQRARIPVVALVGYTNAGKSTLLNRISASDVYVADQLFATLDPTTRRVELPSGNPGLFTDTVGFIQKLPTQLIAAFRATLEEIAQADLLLHVLDISHPDVFAQAESVVQTLEEIKADHIPMLTVINKIDRLADPTMAQAALESFESAAAVSALQGQGIAELMIEINEKLYESFDNLYVMLPYSEGALLALFHDAGQVEDIKHTKDGVWVRGRVPGRLAARFQSFIVEEYSL
jgi:GTP-binding protein HflX